MTTRLRRGPTALLGLLAVAISLLGALGSGCGSSPQPVSTTPVDPDITLLRGATLIDPATGTVQPNAVVVLRGAQIDAVHEAESALYPEGTAALDLHGKYLLPGLIDTHAHVTVLLPDPETGAVAYDHDASLWMLRQLLAHGITAARNPAAPTEPAVALRDGVARGTVPGPRLWTSGEALNRSEASFGPFVSVRTPEEVREEVRRQAQAGVDWIKVYSTLKPDLVAAAIDAARAQGLPVVGHLQQTPWTEAARLGIAGITHAAPWSRGYLPAALHDGYRGTLLDRLDWLEHVDPDGPGIVAMIEALANADVAVDPTLIAFHTKFSGDLPEVTDPPELADVPQRLAAYWKSGSFTADWSPEDYQRGRTLWPNLTALTRRMFDRGVLITAGSDTPNPWVIPGLSLHQELHLLSGAGIPAMDVLKIATINGARALGIDDQAGSIQPGKRADLLILRDNPLADIANTRSIDSVFIGGVRFDPAE